MRPRALLQHVLAAPLWALALLLFTPLALGISAKTLPFSLEDIDGRPLRLADYRGQWLLVSFWAPWCPLCKLQMPTLKKLDSRPDLSVIGIGLDYDSPVALRGSADTHGLGFPIVAGGARRDPNSPHRQIGPVDYFPTSYLYAPNGELVMYIPGQVNSGKVLAFMERWRPEAGAAPAAPATDALAARLAKAYGAAGQRAHADWRQMLDATRAANGVERLRRVNDFFNRRLKQATDARIWGRPDHWATLGETLGKGAGDAEDFALAKYFSLRALGVPVERLRLVYVKTRDAAAGSPAHMVLAYFETPSQEPWLLDVRVAEVEPASRRPDLKPIYSFNGAGAWGDGQGLTELADGRPTQWQDALRRARDEGFD
ncbi:MAG: redoxin domain-containing protein [Pseudomonadota bacterium]